MLTTATLRGAKVSISDFDKAKVGADEFPLCPLGHRLVAKKGKKVVHHFAHYANERCDPWRKSMTNWHAQWQRIVGDKGCVEVCLDVGGNIIGHSSFHGQQGNQTPLLAQAEGHIADIIRPSPPGYRHLVVELQHSSMDKETIIEREKYYQYMVWLFDFTPRLTTKGKHNRLAMIDGSIHYLKDKVNYLGFLSSRSGVLAPKPAGYCVGDEHLLPELTAISGFFVIVNTRTRYWFETSKPTYFDAGFGILRFLHHLDNKLVLTQLISYEQFFKERMPAINPEILGQCSWFHSLDPVDLIKSGMLPKCIDVPEILICQERVVFKRAGGELEGMGLEKGIDDWHWGAYYEKARLAEQTGGLRINSQSNDSVLLGWLNQARNEVKTPTPEASANNAEVLLFTKVRHFLGSTGLELEIVAKKGGDVLIVYCDHTTYGMKERFQALGMTYRKGKAGARGTSAKKATKQTHGALTDAIRGAQSLLASGVPPGPSIAPGAKGELVKNGEDRAHYRGKVKDIQGRLNSLL